MVFSSSETADAMEEIFKKLKVSCEKEVLDSAALDVKEEFLKLNEDSANIFSDLYKEFGHYFIASNITRGGNGFEVQGLIGAGSEDFIKGYLEILNKLGVKELLGSEACFDWFSDCGEGYEKYVYTYTNGSVKNSTEVVPFD